MGQPRQKHLEVITHTSQPLAFISHNFSDIQANQIKVRKEEFHGFHSTKRRLVVVNFCRATRRGS